MGIEPTSEAWEALNISIPFTVIGSRDAPATRPVDAIDRS